MQYAFFSPFLSNSWCYMQETNYLFLVTESWCEMLEEEDAATRRWWHKAFWIQPLQRPLDSLHMTYMDHQSRYLAMPWEQHKANG